MPENQRILRQLCSLSVGLYIFIRCMFGRMFPKVNIDCSISACQHPVYSSGCVKPTGQLCSIFLFRSSETQVVVKTRSEIIHRCVGRLAELTQASLRPSFSLQLLALTFSMNVKTPLCFIGVTGAHPLFLAHGSPAINKQVDSNLQVKPVMDLVLGRCPCLG